MVDRNVKYRIDLDLADARRQLRQFERDLRRATGMAPGGGRGGVGPGGTSYVPGYDFNARQMASGMMSGFRMFRRTVDVLNRGLSRFARGLWNFQNVLTGYAGYRITQGISNAASDFQSSVIQLQKLGEGYRRQGIRVPGGVALARQVQREAVATPFEAKDILEGVRTLMAFQIYRPGDQRNLRAAEDLASTFDRRVEEIAEVFGRLSTGEAVGLSLRSLARFGIVRADIQREDERIKFGKRGELLPDEALIRQYGPAGARKAAGERLLDAVVKAIEREFGGMTQKRMNEFRNQLVNLSDALEQSVIPAGLVLNQFFTPAIQNLSQWISDMSPKFTEWAQAMTAFMSELTEFLPWLQTQRQKSFEATAAGQAAGLEQALVDLDEGKGGIKGLGKIGFWIKRQLQEGGTYLGQGGLEAFGALVTGDFKTAGRMHRKGAGAATNKAMLLWQRSLQQYSEDELKASLARREGAPLGSREALDAIYIQNELNRRASDRIVFQGTLRNQREAERKHDKQLVRNYELIRGTDPGIQREIMRWRYGSGFRMYPGPTSMMTPFLPQWEDRRITHNALVARTRGYRAKFGRPPPVAFGSARERVAPIIMNNSYYGVQNDFGFQGIRSLAAGLR